MMRFLTQMLFVSTVVASMALPSMAETSPAPQTLEVSVPTGVANDNTAMTGTAAENEALALIEGKAPAAGAAEKKAEKALSAMHESEIPVNLGSQQKAAGNSSPLFKIILSLSLVGVLGCAAYFFFKKYVRTTGTQANAKQIKVLTQHYLGPKKSLAIIRVAGESILIGVTDHNISLIKELSLLDEEIPEATPKNFGKLFERQNNQNNFEAAQQDDENRDEFSISGIKDFVATKMKNMRSFE